MHKQLSLFRSPSSAFRLALYPSCWSHPVLLFSIELDPDEPTSHGLNQRNNYSRPSRATDTLAEFERLLS
jgi:hypothetical protein